MQYLKSLFLKSFVKEQIDFINPNLIRKILVLKYDKIGDMVITSPFFRELKKNLPSVEITVLASKVNYPIICRNPHINKIYIYENQWQKLLPTLFKLRKQKYDLCFEFEAGFVTRAFLLTKIINPKYVVSVFKQHGRYNLSAEQLKVYDFYTNFSPESHRSLNILDTLSVFGMVKKNNKYELFPDKKSIQFTSDFLKNFSVSSKKIGINLQGITFTGGISNQKLIDIIQGLNNMFDDLIFFILASPWEENKVERMLSQINISNVFGTYFNIDEVITFISQLDLVISVDTSIVHIACALDTPLVAIYAKDKTNYHQWHPVSKKFEVVFSKSLSDISNFKAGSVIEYSAKLLNS